MASRASAQRSAEAKKAADFQTAMRQAIAAAMARSNREIPHYYLETQIDMSKALRWLEEENTRRTIKDRLLPVRRAAQSGRQGADRSARAERLLDR